MTIAQLPPHIETDLTRTVQNTKEEQIQARPANKLEKVDANNRNFLASDPIYTTNLSAFPIEGLSLHHDFISDDEMHMLVDLLDTGDENDSLKNWKYSGFPKRRKQRIILQNIHETNNENSDDSTCSQAYDKKWEWLIKRVHNLTSKSSITTGNDDIKEHFQKPNVILVEEYRGASPSGANVFEPNLDSTSYIAELIIGNHTLQSYKRPIERSDECWDLIPDKNTKILTLKNSLLVKTGESLYDWRCNNSSSLQHWKNKSEINDGSDKYLVGLDLPDGMGKLTRGKDYRCISIKMRYDANPEKFLEHEVLNGVKKRLSTLKVNRQVNYIPPLSDLLTIIVTTSPIKSNPSTEVLEKAFETFELAGHDFAYKCRKIIMCDGLRLQEDKVDKSKKQSKVTKKHSNVKQALRNGIANHDQAKKYRLFKIALMKLCAEADVNFSKGELSPFYNTKVVELKERHGYGFALREAVQEEHVTTPYVCVIQHDRTFMRKTPLYEVVQSMMNHSDQIKYVGMNMRSNLLLRDIFIGKYGRVSYEELEKIVIRPPELNLPASIYGRNGSSVKEMVSMVSDRIRRNIIELQKTYFNCQQGISYLDWLKDNNLDDSERRQCTLTPTLFWYDNIHVTESKHYRDFIFDPKFKMVARGGFVEDKLSPVIVRSVERRGLSKGHERFGCYILDDHSGMFFTGHLDGGSYLTAEEKEALIRKQSLQRKQK